MGTANLAAGAALKHGAADGLDLRVVSGADADQIGERVRSAAVLGADEMMHMQSAAAATPEKVADAAAASVAL